MAAESGERARLVLHVWAGRRVADLCAEAAAAAGPGYRFLSPLAAAVHTARRRSQVQASWPGLLPQRPTCAGAEPLPRQCGGPRSADPGHRQATEY